jgi:hypothetical protein
MQDFRVELKVCEGCGGLWLRNKSGAYCNSCVRWLSEFPAPKRTKSDAQPIRRQRIRQKNRAAAQITAAHETSTVMEVVA